MEFRKLSLGAFFSFQNEFHRAGVKITEKTAFMLDTKHEETIVHNRACHQLHEPDGRLARDREGHVCLVHVLNNGMVSGYRVIPVSYVEGRRDEFDFIAPEVGEMNIELDIMLRHISQSRQNTGKLLEALGVMLSNMPVADN